MNSKGVEKQSRGLGTGNENPETKMQRELNELRETVALLKAGLDVDLKHPGEAVLLFIQHHRQESNLAHLISERFSAEAISMALAKLGIPPQDKPPKRLAKKLVDAYEPHKFQYSEGQSSGQPEA